MTEIKKLEGKQPPEAFSPKDVVIFHVPFPAPRGAKQQMLDKCLINLTI